MVDALPEPVPSDGAQWSGATPQLGFTSVKFVPGRPSGVLVASTTTDMGILDGDSLDTLWSFPLWNNVGAIASGLPAAGTAPLLIADGGAVRVLDLLSSRSTWLPHSFRHLSVMTSLSGGTIAVGTHFGLVHLCRTLLNQPCVEIAAAHSGEVTALTESRNGDGTSFISGGEDGKVFVWVVAPDGLRATQRIDVGGKVIGLEALQDGRLLIATVAGLTCITLPNGS